jgi:hypothetical protein
MDTPDFVNTGSPCVSKQKISSYWHTANGDRILSRPVVDGQQRDTLHVRLGDQNPIKRVVMDR